MSPLDLFQWPAMLVTVLGSWLVASRKKARRKLGLWRFYSNGLWVVWGLHTHAYALITLQLFLLVMNLRELFEAQTNTSES